MLISAPFLKSGTVEDNTDRIQYAYTGQYPVTSRLEWHNGQHLIAPQDGNGYAEVRAIADGKVIYIDKPDAAPSADKAHAQNYATFGSGPEWTDKGMVIIEHITEIGAAGNTPTAITFYSVYAHLKEIAPGVAAGKSIYRKDIIGKPGQIYGEAGHLHFEICFDDANIKQLLGKSPTDWPTADAAPTADGRTDAVFGSTYVYLPAGTPTQATAPTTHLQSTAARTLAAPQWVQIEYAGYAKLVSYTIKGDKIAERSDADAEYELYKEANKRHDSLSAADKANSSPSGWYELLRFGRNLGRGPAATDKDPLPANAEHWRKIQTPTGEVWANLNAAGTFKLSDADFPAFLGWNCFGDDTQHADQRCDSTKLKALLTSEIEDPEQKAKTLKSHERLFAQTRNATIARKLRKAICKFPTEFDQGNFEARYGHIKETEYFKADTTGKSWELLSAHIKALTKTDLPQKYKDAMWHLHPVEFVDVMRRCGWLGKAELKQMVPMRVIRHQKYKANASTPLEHRYHWEPVNFTPASALIDVQCVPLNRMMRKFGITTPKRQASFLGNAIQETGWLSVLQEGSPTGYWYSPWFGRGFLQLTHADNYIEYWRWIGRSVPESLKTALRTAATQAHSANSDAALQDLHFPALNQEMRNWREHVSRGDQSDAANSAGFYWAMKDTNRNADGAHVLERQTVTQYAAPDATLSYYRSVSFWEACAKVNLPGAFNTPWSLSLNGFVDRCCAYTQVLMVVSEMQFPTASGTSLLPETMTPRRV